MRAGDALAPHRSNALNQPPHTPTPSLRDHCKTSRTSLFCAAKLAREAERSSPGFQRAKPNLNPLLFPLDHQWGGFCIGLFPERRNPCAEMQSNYGCDISSSEEEGVANHKQQNP